MSEDMSIALPARATLRAAPARILERLPQFDRVMIVVRAQGATHERIGRVEQVTSTGGRIIVAGAAHDSVIDLDAITGVIVDSTSKMKDKVLPRLDFTGGDGAVLFSVIGLEGLAPFQAGLKGLDLDPVAPVERAPSVPATLEDGDPGAVPLLAAASRPSPVSIEVVVPGIRQSWRGPIEAVKPAMGFANVMTGDFHLHLRGGSVASWRAEIEGETCVLIAEDAQAVPTGLRLRGDRSAFAS